MISADCHGGASARRLPAVPGVEVPRRLRPRGRPTFENPYDDNTGADADRNWSSERRLREMEADGVVAEVIFPNTDPAVLPEGLARRASRRRDRGRPRASAGRAAGAQPLAGRLLQRRRPDAGPGSRRSCSTTSTRRCARSSGPKANGLTGGVLLPGAPPGLRRAAAVRPGLRADLVGVRGPRHADQPPQRQRRAGHGPYPAAPDDVPARGHLVGPPARCGTSSTRA